MIDVCSQFTESVVKHSQCSAEKKKVQLGNECFEWQWWKVDASMALAGTEQHKKSHCTQCFLIELKFSLLFTKFFKLSSLSFLLPLFVAFVVTACL